MKRLLIGTALVMALTAPVLGQGSPPAAKATFVDTKGEQVGTATLVQAPGGVLIEAEIRNLPPGEHAFHIHEAGKCQAGDEFKSAADHFAPSGKKHGYEMAGGPHAGDMPNQFVGQDGVLKLNVFNPNVTLAGGNGSLLDRDGSALVIHAKADDYKSQPSGDAGNRLACAVIQK